MASPTGEPWRAGTLSPSSKGLAMLLPGHWVEVLPASEILQTLDAFQAMDGLPFMPEMLPFCGKRFQVARRAERTCSYMPGPLRRMEHAVTLGRSTCDGAMHGGCQMGCVFFWNEAWLKPGRRARLDARRRQNRNHSRSSAPRGAPTRRPSSVRRRRCRRRPSQGHRCGSRAVRPIPQGADLQRRRDGRHVRETAASDDPADDPQGDPAGSLPAPPRMRPSSDSSPVRWSKSGAWTRSFARWMEGASTRVSRSVARCTDSAATG